MARQTKPCVTKTRGAMAIQLIKRVAPSSDGSTFARYIRAQLSANAGAPTAVPSHEPATLMMAAIE
jgi:hypothetical protein